MLQEKIFNKYILKILFFLLLLSLFVVCWNVVFPTMINEYTPFWQPQNEDGIIDDTFLVEVYNYHQENPVFAARPAVTWMIEMFSTYTSLTVPQSFVLVQFFLILLAGMALVWCAQAFQKHVPVFVTLLLFYASFSVLFAFFAPIYTYDDFLQYIFLFLSIGLAQRGMWRWYIPIMTIAIWVREPSLILLPSFLILWMKNIKDWKKALMLLSPAALYWLVQWVTLDPSLISANAVYLQADRFAHFIYNTRTPDRIWEMVFSITVVLALPLYVVIRAKEQVTKRYTISFVLVLLLNTLAAVVGTRIQESRILALPLLLFWPIAAKPFVSLVRQYRLRISFQKILLFLFFLIAIWQFVFVKYHSTDVYAISAPFQWYAGILFLLLAVHRSFSKKIDGKQINE